MIASASMAFLNLSSLLAATTSFKSSTLYALVLSTSLTHEPTFLGTDMSIKRRFPPTSGPTGGRSTMFSFKNKGVSDEVLVKITSASPAHVIISPTGL
ncbi:hypothetical protein HanPI659440_Chr10g0361191 [Helianthus annuus]|nr:hypothetical protein HanPI659440_Chr10g0361191 [Helianthus annuus]